MSYLSAADAWIYIVVRVHSELDADTFAQWLELVGIGDDFDRCRKGERFYKMMTGAKSPIVEVPYERSIQSNKPTLDPVDEIN